MFVKFPSDGGDSVAVVIRAERLVNFSGNWLYLARGGPLSV